MSLCGQGPAGGLGWAGDLSVWREVPGPGPPLNRERGSRGATPSRTGVEIEISRKRATARGRGEGCDEKNKGMCACVCARVCAHVHACVFLCVRVRKCRGDPWHVCEGGVSLGGALAASGPCVLEPVSSCSQGGVHAAP